MIFSALANISLDVLNQSVYRGIRFKLSIIRSLNYNKRRRLQLIYISLIR